MGSRAEHRAVADQAIKDALAALDRGDDQTYQRERQVAIAHAEEARQLAEQEGR